MVFHHFVNEFSYTGRHNWEMTDYALMYFNAANYTGVAPRDFSEVPVSDSLSMRWNGFSWNGWMTGHGFGADRFDLLPSRAQLSQILLNNNLPYEADRGHYHAYFMVDLEDPAMAMDLNTLRAQTWYPPSILPDLAFENRYYNGFVNTQLAAVDAAKAQGWPSVGLYGWMPFLGHWGNYATTTVNPATDWAWNRYGKYICRGLDVIYFTTYFFYWNEFNVAYALARTDFNFQMIADESVQKPLRPYISNLIYNPTPEYRWWNELPVRTEDFTARTAMNFFTGTDGLVFWGDSDVTNHHQVELAEREDYSVKSLFSAPVYLTPIGTTPLSSIERYEAIHVLDIDQMSSTVYFQVVQPDLPRPYGIDLGWQVGSISVVPKYPIYRMGISNLKNHLRRKSEPVAALIEGLALVRPFEYTLKHGEVKIDVPSKIQFRDVLPIIRRVKLGDYHIVITYDPRWQTYPAGRNIQLEDFDGVENLELNFPADAKTRIFVLKNGAAN